MSFSQKPLDLDNIMVIFCKSRWYSSSFNRSLWKQFPLGYYKVREGLNFPLRFILKFHTPFQKNLESYYFDKLYH